jgi:heme-degrading monooxygenase HmoA
MKRVLARLNVENFEQWKAAYESHEQFRQQHGCKGTTFYRHDQDSNEVVLIQEWDSLDNYHSFISGTNLKEIQKNSGAIPKDVFVLNSF